jgi:hypothetical protein
VSVTDLSLEPKNGLPDEAARSHKSLYFNSSRGGTRTHDPLINSLPGLFREVAVSAPMSPSERDLGLGPF